jgi:hypothetical protein
MSLPGPSRTIIVDPVERPDRAPAPEPAEPDPEYQPAPAQPREQPEKTPAR